MNKMKMFIAVGTMAVALSFGTMTAFAGPHYYQANCGGVNCTGVAGTHRSDCTYQAECGGVNCTGTAGTHRDDCTWNKAPNSNSNSYNRGNRGYHHGGNRGTRGGHCR